jgi:predicted enzyme related to lactoylglutathione lyase
MSAQTALMRFRMSKIMHFEIGADDPKRAIKFYENVFGWKSQKYEGGNMDYWLVMAGEKAEPGINGAIQPRTGLPQSVINTIMVESIDETINKITENGGKIVVPKMEIPKVGVMVYFQDTEGNIFGAMQADSPIRSGWNRYRANTSPYLFIAQKTNMASHQCICQTVVNPDIQPAPSGKRYHVWFHGNKNPIRSRTSRGHREDYNNGGCVI